MRAHGHQLAALQKLPPVDGEIPPGGIPRAAQLFPLQELAFFLRDGAQGRQERLSHSSIPPAIKMSKNPLLSAAGFLVETVRIELMTS